MSVAHARRRSVPAELRAGCLYAAFHVRRRHKVCAYWDFAPAGTDVPTTFDQSCTVSSFLLLLAAHGCSWAAELSGVPSSAWHLMHVQKGPGVSRRFKLIRGDMLVLDIPNGVWMDVAIVPDIAVIAPDDLLPGTVTPDDRSYFRPYCTR